MNTTIPLHPTAISTTELCSPATPLPDVHPTEMYTYIHQNTCTNLFMTALSMLVPKWKQMTQRTSPGGWIQQWYRHTREYNETTKRTIHSHTKQRGSILRTQHAVKEARHRGHTLCVLNTHGPLCGPCIKVQTLTKGVFDIRWILQGHE